MKLATLAIALLIATPAFAADAPATQPAEKPKAKHNDAPPRKKVPLVVKTSADLWKLLPEELRPGKDGKVSEELAAKIEAWLKENEGKIEGQVQFVCTTTTSHPKNVDSFNCVLKDKEGAFATAPVTDEKEIAKVKAVKYDTVERKCPEILGQVEEVKLVKVDNTSRLSVELKESKVVSVKLVKRTT